jgi:hypothetical protein
MNPGYKPGERFGTSFETHEWNAITPARSDDASAQSDLICAPQPIIIDQTQAAQLDDMHRAVLG